jgi:hypothetical protein
VSAIVLVQALGVEEVDMGYGCVGDFYVDFLGWCRGRIGDGGGFEDCDVLYICCYLRASYSCLDGLTETNLSMWMAFIVAG